MKKSKTSAMWLIGGGAVVGATAWILSRRSAATSASVERALAGEIDPETGERGLVNVKLTGYWPFTARPDEVQMEGGTKDRRGNPLHTVEDYFAGRADHVSLSGDDAIFPYGQKLLIPWGDQTIVGRVTDTGSHFRGVHKIYRVSGREPIDVCVQSSATKIPNSNTTARIVAGDNYAGGRAVATSGIRDQNVIVGGDDGARSIERDLFSTPRRDQEAEAWTSAAIAAIDFLRRGA